MNDFPSALPHLGNATSHRYNEINVPAMNRPSQQLFFLAALWCSVVALLLGATTMLPKGARGDLRENAPALLLAFSNEKVIPAALVPSASGKAIIVNLETMRLALYENGELRGEYPVLSRGKEGTPWETPRGRYVIQTKEPRHFSSIGEVWMPYSMQFYGNFFIHGWPTFRDGTNVPPGYSGGCIRLETSDAKEVYEFATIGTTVMIDGARAKEEFATSSRYFLRGSGVPLPEISAKAFLVADAETGEVLWSRAADIELHPGKLTSLLSAWTALETVNQYKEIQVKELLRSARQLRGSVLASEKIPIGALIYPLLFDANDAAAKVFADVHGKAYFTRAMNEKAVATGMTASSWAGPLSTDPATTTARDLFLFALGMDRNKHFLVEATAKEAHAITTKEGKERYTWTNKNPWIVSGDSAYRGGMAAEGNAILFFNLPLAEFGGRKIVFVLLGSGDVASDVESLRTFISRHWVWGIDRTAGPFIAEENDEKGSILFRAKELLDLRRLLEEKVEYEREV